MTEGEFYLIGLKALSIEGQSPASDGKLNDKTSEENIIPWTIVNRYYTADVHFAAHVIHGMSPMVFDKPHIPPAVIYVWVDGEVRLFIHDFQINISYFLVWAFTAIC